MTTSRLPPIAKCYPLAAKGERRALAPYRFTDCVTTGFRAFYKERSSGERIGSETVQAKPNC